MYLSVLFVIYSVQRLQKAIFAVLNFQIELRHAVLKRKTAIAKI